MLPSLRPEYKRSREVQHLALGRSIPRVESTLLQGSLGQKPVRGDVLVVNPKEQRARGYPTPGSNRRTTFAMGEQA